jgi:hypothetical protein
MSNYNVHAAAGVIVSLILAFFLYTFVHVNPLILALGVVIAVISCEFPDIDYNKSMPRKVMRGLVPGVVIFFALYYFFTNQMWNAPLLNIILLVIVAVGFILSYEKFIPHHRGPTHKLPGLLVLVVASVAIAFILGFGFINALLLALFAAVGFAIHLILDHL